MSRSQREKGKRWEREVARRLRPIYGDSVRRGWQARQGADACDVEGTPWRIEAKCGACPNPRAALDQAQRDAERAGDTRPVVVVLHDDGSGARAPREWVAMPMGVWLELCGGELP